MKATAYQSLVKMENPMSSSSNATSTARWTSHVLALPGKLAPPARLFEYCVGHMVCQTCTCRGHIASTFCEWAAVSRTMFKKSVWLDSLMPGHVKGQLYGVKAIIWPCTHTGTMANSNCFSRAQACCTASLWSHSSCAGLQGQVCPELSPGACSESSFGKSLNFHCGLL